jgi:hypothetical protein
MKRISLAAVIAGGVTDVAVSGIVGTPLVFYVIISRHLAGMPKAQMSAAMKAAIHSSPLLFSVQMTLGLLCSVLGAWVGARVARHDEVLNGLASMSLGTVVGIMDLASGKSSNPLWLQLVLMLILVPACGLLGGRLARKRRPAAAAVSR